MRISMIPFLLDTWDWHTGCVGTIDSFTRLSGKSPVVSSEEAVGRGTIFSEPKRGSTESGPVLRASHSFSHLIFP